MKGRKIITYGVTSLQVTLLLIIILLEYLSGYRAGVAQHLYFKKIHYIGQYYQGVPLMIHGTVLLILTGVAVRAGYRSEKGLIGLCKFFALLTVLCICYFAEFFRELNSYAHILMVLEFCLMLEVMSLWLNRPANQNR